MLLKPLSEKSGLPQGVSVFLLRFFCWFLGRFAIRAGVISIVQCFNHSSRVA